MSKATNIKWFPVAHGGRGRIKETVMRITFANKTPKSIRFNSAFTRELKAKDVQYVQVGINEDNVLIIKPVKEDNDAFKVNGLKRSASICSTAIGIWAKQSGLLEHRGIPGEYDEENDTYVFDLKEYMQQDVAATKEDTAE